ncbi:7-cyano-7-deazaguanine synthase [Candidatus Enterococcus ikei]|uniref:7-cyano-7-deazaguanine synthase n=1 Tax=Candidatus Enterococcus ikei TaxID=2815326 RepID=A0ABS3GVH7_9ENTE|nr:7-cyano-7-deazaguanine synthase [Enterococcus sp. DIV0869a]MBO0439262.1 7-cyano-7-deazaguanine synthase [Enterococcus sp. DIV0869a]
MKKLMYIPVSANISLVEENKNLVDSSYSFEETTKTDLYFELSSELRNKIKNDFILEYCLSIAIAEAYDADEIIIPVNIAYIAQQTDNVSGFLHALKRLAHAGTLKKINVRFSESDNYFREYKFNANYLNEILSNLNIKSALNIYSGGLDCTVASAYLEKEKIKQQYIFYDYGQNNIKEEKLCVKKQCVSRNIDVADITFDKELKNFFNHIKFSTGLLSNKKITLKNKKDEYVPFRNSLFIAYSLNFSYSEDKDITHIITGSHLDDVNSPDNNPLYYNIWNNLLKLTHHYNHTSVLPILFKFGGKTEVVKLGHDLNVDFSQTWTCHNKSIRDEILIQCGNCNDCKVREEAFKKNHLMDPMQTAYLETTSKVEHDMEHVDLILDLIKKIKESEETYDLSSYASKSLEEFGFDSLMAIHLITLLEDRYDIEIDGDYLIDFNYKNPIEIGLLINKVRLIDE